MRKLRLEWTDLPKDFLSAGVRCFIDGKWRLSSIVTLDRQGNYKLEIGNGWITGNLKTLKQSGQKPMKTEWAPDRSGRSRHKMNAPINTTQVKLGPPSALEILQECVASEPGVCPCGRINWFLKK